MKTLLILALVASCLLGSPDPARAQEDWSQETLPPLYGNPVDGPSDIPQYLSGTEYILVHCEPFRSNVDFACADAPGRIGYAYVPIRLFARSSTVEGLAMNVDQLTSRLTADEAAFALLDARVGSLSDRIESIADMMVADRRAARRGIAAAMAIGNASLPSAPGRTTYDFNLATYRGQDAFGASFMHRLDTADPMAVTFGFSAAGHGDVGGRIGLAGEF